MWNLKKRADYANVCTLNVATIKWNWVHNKQVETKKKIIAIKNMKISKWNVKKWVPK